MYYMHLYGEIRKLIILLYMVFVITNSIYRECEDSLNLANAETSFTFFKGTGPG